MSRLKGKTALITGASSGIGLATCKRFIAEGAEVFGFDLQQPSKDAGLKACFNGDVRDTAALTQAVAQLMQAQGRLDVLVNAAGVSSGGPSEDIPEDEWQRVIDINLKGSLLAVQQALKGAMLTQRAGSIVNIASIEGLEGFTGQTSYGVSKGGVVQLTRNLAVDYGELGIRVNCVCPGLIETPMTAVMKDPSLRHIEEQMISHHLLGRIGQAEEVAAAILFLASDDASFVTGHALVVDGGYTAGRRYAI